MKLTIHVIMLKLMLSDEVRYYDVCCVVSVILCPNKIILSIYNY